MIRAMKQEDVELLKKIHEEYYEHEFNFPNFEDKFLGCFVATNDDGNIVSAGGVRTLCESVLITDKRQPVAIRREALYDIMAASMYVANKFNYKELHAFIQEVGWKSHLEKVGFEPTVGESLILKF